MQGLVLRHEPGSSGSIVSDYGARSPTETKDFSSTLFVQTRSEVHPASYPMGTADPFPGVKLGRGVTLNTHHI